MIELYISNNCEFNKSTDMILVFCFWIICSQNIQTCDCLVSLYNLWRSDQSVHIHNTFLLNPVLLLCHLVLDHEQLQHEHGNHKVFDHSSDVLRLPHLAYLQTLQKQNRGDFWPPKHLLEGHNVPFHVPVRVWNNHLRDFQHKPESFSRLWTVKILKTRCKFKHCKKCRRPSHKSLHDEWVTCAY